MTTVLEALQSAQFVVDTTGQKVAVQVTPAVWEALINWLKTSDSVPTVEELLGLADEVPQAKLQSEVHIAQEDATLTYSAMKLSEPSFARVWDNPEDDIYNDL
ncbi:hypothetical protein Lepto7375DRAFT_3478 [Leptolyngbya sp. PCC 7375]|nr:hypothetical protein Lepto7375DRAFT_3478 [Leptolyngbya sp. PCC 7375]